MAKRTEKSSPRRRPAAIEAEARSFDGRRLTAIALGIAVAIVIARVCMSEAIRQVGFVSPGAEAAPAGPGPASGLVLDLIALLCPMLVLARRWIDPTFSLRWSVSPLIYLLLALWAVASTLWANDRFAAVISAVHLLAAASLLWAVAQSVSGWRYVWLISAFCVGLLAVLLVQGIWYQFVDRPALIERFHNDPSFVVKSQNVQPGTFEYGQLINSIEHGELRGFSVSPNTYAAQLVLLGLITLGTLGGCIRLRHWMGVSICGIVAITDVLVLPLTQSRAGMITGALGVTLLAIIIIGTWPRDGDRPSLLANLLRRQATLLYMAGATVVLAVAAFIIGYGVSRGTLFHDSLNFRWRYWTASFELLKKHLLFGVGWENFGDSYLAVRSPEATEEIKDPHNYLVRYATELGIIGLTLALAWTARTWWELTRPAGLLAGPTDDPRREEPAGARTLLLLAAPIAAGILLNEICAIDWTSDWGFVISEIVRRLVFLFALLAGATMVAFRMVRNAEKHLSLHSEEAAAPELLVALLIGLGMFFIHSLNDFVMFETGPMFLFAVLLGAAVGFRSSAAKEPASQPQRGGARRARLGVIITGGVWLLLAILLVGPVISAEADAADGDERLRRSMVDNRIIPQQVESAAQKYEDAFSATVRNAAYASRAALAWNLIGKSDRARTAFDAAIAADPGNAANYARRAEFAAQLQPPDYTAAARDMGQSIAIDPMNRLDRLRYATFLEQIDRPDEAIAQILRALELNERLTPVERRRFTADQVREVPQMLTRLMWERIWR